MAKLVTSAEATHVFTAQATKDGQPIENFRYYVIEGNETGHMTVKDAIREIEEEGWYIKSSQTRPAKRPVTVEPIPAPQRIQQMMGRVLRKNP